ncbi:MAG: hypothetical protein H7X74_01130 [Methyloceanibacter sp.]|nr:hypothetical protein [Methyloceanibacter sp.]
MQSTHPLAKTAAALTGAVFALALMTASGFAASQFEGKWKVQDTKGNPFEITLSEDGAAKGSRTGEGLSGTWKAEGDAAVINWDSGWTTKITKQGNQYKKTAFEKGKAEGAPTDAQKVE